MMMRVLALGETSEGVGLCLRWLTKPKMLLTHRLLLLLLLRGVVVIGIVVTATDYYTLTQGGVLRSSQKRDHACAYETAESKEREGLSGYLQSEKDDGDRHGKVKETG